MEEYTFAPIYEDTVEAFYRDPINESSCETTQQGSDVYQSEQKDNSDELPTGTEESSMAIDEQSMRNVGQQTRREGPKLPGPQVQTSTVMREMKKFIKQEL